jgi:hypothetical protein
MCSFARPPLLFVAAPCARSDDPRYATLCKDCVTEMSAAIGAVSKHLAGVVGQRIGTGLAIVDIGRGDRYFLNQRCISVRSNMGLEAMHSPLSLMFYPAGLVIVFADAIIVASTSVPVLTVTAFDLS